MKRITIKILKGQMRVETEGYVGSTCDAVHAAFHMPGASISEEVKPEYYQVSDEDTLTQGN